MKDEPLVSLTIAPANNFLWAVKCYLDLISGDGLLTPGSGLKRLYVMSAGVMTYNVTDIEAITQQAEQLKILSGNLRGYLHQSILKNLYLYGQELQRLIGERIVAIAKGEVKNPQSFVNYNTDEARRHFYVPPATFLKRLNKALRDDTGLQDWAERFPSEAGKFPVSVNQLEDVAMDAELLLTQMQGSEGYASPTETSWSYLNKTVEELVDLLKSETRYPKQDAAYKRRSRPALRILLVITKLVLGDLTSKPQTRDTNLVDLDQKLNLSDGTLVAIPFPLGETVKLFEDSETNGLSMKARRYLSAVSAAAFYRTKRQDEEGC